MSASLNLVRLLLLSSLVGVAGCDGFEGGEPETPDAGVEEAPPPPPTEPPPRERVDSRPPPMAQPVPLWREGQVAREVDAATADVGGFLLLDLGEAWTPYLFTEQGNESEDRIPHSYRETYLALARGETPDDHHGARASRDRYLELYGIMPTLGAIRERMRRVRDLECATELDLAPLETFEGFVAYRNNPTARREAAHFDVLERQVERLVATQEVDGEAHLDESGLGDREARALREYRGSRARHEAIRAAQDRLRCEGYFEGKGRYTRGGLDWATHEALAEFERRHRIYAWGFIGRETLDHLRRSPLELEAEAVIRVLTERAMHSLGVIEDGSAPPSGRDQARTFRGRDGVERPVPNLEAELRERIVAALGLTSPDATFELLEGLGELPPAGERLIAIEAPELPEYYDDDMDIQIEIDRGDVWYEFPYDEEGNERSQPVQRRPRLSVIVQYEGQRIPIARLGTTIGGWRSEQIDGHTLWRYKNSPTGPRIWHQIVSAPVWLPPESTPHRELLRRVPGRSGRDAYMVNRHETGPSYASAYGLVAAYHLRYREGADGEFNPGGDEGIRTHGSVDYMSIMRRHSHGCHRLHNHLAVRLMSWVLAHRHHRRVGHQSIGFRRNLRHEGHTYEMAIDRGGYVFDLERPVVVNVLEGRILGSRSTPIEEALPRFDSEAGAYLTPAGEAVRISRSGVLTPYELPEPEGEDLDGVVDEGEPPPAPALLDPFAGDPRLAPLSEDG